MPLLTRHGENWETCTELSPNTGNQCGMTSGDWLICEPADIWILNLADFILASSLQQIIFIYTPHFPCITLPLIHYLGLCVVTTSVPLVTVSATMLAWRTTNFYSYPIFIPIFFILQNILHSELYEHFDIFFELFFSLIIWLEIVEDMRHISTYISSFISLNNEA